MRHEYSAELVWTGNPGDGTRTYAGYGRDHRVGIGGKPDLFLSADKLFRGSSDKHNPEDLFVAAIAGCHLLEYLALCARRGVSVLTYEDRAVGTVTTNTDGSGRFESVLLRPTVTIAPESSKELALQLHRTAHEHCFIANSCSVPIRVEPDIQVAAMNVVS